MTVGAIALWFLFAVALHTLVAVVAYNAGYRAGQYDNEVGRRVRGEHR